MQVEEPIHCLLWKQELLPGSGRCNDSGYKRWVCCCLIGFYYAVIQQFTNRSKKSILSSFLVPVGLSDCPGVPGTFGGPTGEIWGRKDQSEPEFWWKTCHSPTLLDTVELPVSFCFFLFLSFSLFSFFFFLFLLFSFVFFSFLDLTWLTWGISSASCLHLIRHTNWTNILGPVLLWLNVNCITRPKQ